MENIKSYTQFITESAKTDAIVDGVRQAIENGHSPEFTKDELTAFCRRGGGDGRTVTFLLTSDKAFLRKAGRGHNYFFDTEDGKTFMWHDLDAGDTATPTPQKPNVVTQTLSEEEVKKIIRETEDEIKAAREDYGDCTSSYIAREYTFGPLDNIIYFDYSTGELHPTVLIGKYRGDGNPKDREEVVKISSAEYKSDLSRECERNFFGNFTLTLKGAVIKLVNLLEERGIIVAHKNKITVYHCWAW